MFGIILMGLGTPEIMLISLLLIVPIIPYITYKIGYKNGIIKGENNVLKSSGNQ